MPTIVKKYDEVPDELKKLYQQQARYLSTKGGSGDPRDIITIIDTNDQGEVTNLSLEEQPSGLMAGLSSAVYDAPANVSGILAGVAATPFVTPVGGFAAGFGTGAVVDRVQDAIVRKVAPSVARKMDIIRQTSPFISALGGSASAAGVQKNLLAGAGRAAARELAKGGERVIPRVLDVAAKSQGMTKGQLAARVGQDLAAGAGITAGSQVLGSVWEDGSKTLGEHLSSIDPMAVAGASLGNVAFGGGRMKEGYRKGLDTVTGGRFSKMEPPPTSETLGGTPLGNEMGTDTGNTKGDATITPEFNPNDKMDQFRRYRAAYEEVMQLQAAANGASVPVEPTLRKFGFGDNVVLSKENYDQAGTILGKLEEEVKKRAEAGKKRADAEAEKAAKEKQRLDEEAARQATLTKITGAETPVKLAVNPAIELARHYRGLSTEGQVMDVKFFEDLQKLNPAAYQKYVDDMAAAKIAEKAKKTAGEAAKAEKPKDGLEVVPKGTLTVEAPKIDDAEVTALVDEFKAERINGMSLTPKRVRDMAFDEPELLEKLRTLYAERVNQRIVAKAEAVAAKAPVVEAAPTPKVPPVAATPVVATPVEVPKAPTPVEVPKIVKPVKAPETPNQQAIRNQVADHLRSAIEAEKASSTNTPEETAAKVGELEKALFDVVSGKKIPPVYVKAMKEAQKEPKNPTKRKLGDTSEADTENAYGTSDLSTLNTKLSEPAAVEAANMKNKQRTHKDDPKLTEDEVHSELVRLLSFEPTLPKTAAEYKDWALKAADRLVTKARKAANAVRLDAPLPFGKKRDISKADIAGTRVIDDANKQKILRGIETYRGDFRSHHLMVTADGKKVVITDAQGNRLHPEEFTNVELANQKRVELQQAFEGKGVVTTKVEPAVTPIAEPAKTSAKQPKGKKPKRETPEWRQELVKKNENKYSHARITLDPEGKYQVVFTAGEKAGQNYGKPLDTWEQADLFAENANKHAKKLEADAKKAAKAKPAEPEPVQVNEPAPKVDDSEQRAVARKAIEEVVDEYGLKVNEDWMKAIEDQALALHKAKPDMDLGIIARGYAERSQEVQNAKKANAEEKDSVDVTQQLPLIREAIVRISKEKGLQIDSERMKVIEDEVLTDLKENPKTKSEDLVRKALQEDEYELQKEREKAQKEELREVERRKQIEKEQAQLEKMDEEEARAKARKTIERVKAKYGSNNVTESVARDLEASAMGIREKYKDINIEGLIWDDAEYKARKLGWNKGKAADSGGTSQLSVDFFGSSAFNHIPGIAKLLGRVLKGSAKMAGKALTKAADVIPAGVGERLRRAFPREGNYVQQRLKLLRNEQVKLHNQFDDPVDRVMKALKPTETEIRHVTEFMDSEEMNDGFAPFRLTDRERQLKEALRESLLVSGTMDNTPWIENTRPKQFNPNYAAGSIMSGDVRKAIRNRTAEGEAYRNEYIAWYRSRSGDDSSDAANKALDLMTGLGMRKIDPGQPSFAAVRKAEGIGLPPSMREKSIVNRLYYLNARTAADIAYHRVVEKDPVMGRIFGHINNGAGVDYYQKDAKGNLIRDTATMDPAVMAQFIPKGDVEPVRELSGNEDIEAIRGELMLARNANADLTEKLAGLVNSFRLGPTSTVRDIGSSLHVLANHVPAKEWLHVLDAMDNMFDTATGKGYVRSKRASDWNTTEQGVAEGLARISDFMRTVSGRELGEKAVRSVIGNFGEIIGGNQFDKAIGGGSSEFLDFMVGKNWRELPRDEVTRIAGQALMEQVQGNYSFDYLPRQLLRSHEGAVVRWLFNLQRWSIERARRFREEALVPLAERGDIKPLLKQTMGGMIGMAGVEAVLELLAGQGSRMVDAKDMMKMMKSGDLSIAQKLDELMHESAARFQMMGIGGMYSALLNNLNQIRHGEPLLPIENPAMSFMTDMMQRVVGAVEGMGTPGKDVNPVKFFTKLGMESLMDEVQLLRVIRNRMEGGVREDRRLEDQWKRVTGQTRADVKIVRRPNRFSPTTQLKWAKTEEDVIALEPKLEEYYRRRGLKHPTTVEDPVKEREYYNYLTSIQGYDAAKERFEQDKAKRVLVEKKKAAARTAFARAN